MKIMKVVILSLTTLFIISLASVQVRAKELLKPHLPLLPQKINPKISRHPLPPIHSVKPLLLPIKLKNKQSSKSIKMLVPTKVVVARRTLKERLKKLYLSRKKIRLDLTKKEKVIARRRLLFRQQLRKIRDSEKEKIISNISEKLSQLNNRLVERLMKGSEKMLEIEAKLESRTKLLEKKNVDVSQLQEQEEEFKLKVEKYKNDLLLQKSKAYLPDLEANKNLGQAVRQVLLEFKSDFRGLRLKFHDLRKELVDIVKLMAKLNKENLTPTPVLREAND